MHHRRTDLAAGSAVGAEALQAEVVDEAGPGQRLWVVGIWCGAVNYFIGGVIGSSKLVRGGEGMYEAWCMCAQQHVRTSQADMTTSSPALTLRSTTLKRLPLSWPAKTKGANIHTHRSAHNKGYARHTPRDHSSVLRY